MSRWSRRKETVVFVGKVRIYMWKDPCGMPNELYKWFSLEAKEGGENGGCEDVCFRFSRSSFFEGIWLAPNSQFRS